MSQTHKCCDCHKVYGAPGYTDEVCKKCGEKWSRFRAGSWDWEYRDCSKCTALGVDTAALAAHKTQDTDCTNATVLTKGEK